VGFSTPTNPVATRLNEGWNLAGGVGVTKGYVGIMADVLVTGFGFTDTALARAGARKGSDAVLDIMVGMMMRGENVAQAVKRHPSGQELARRTVSAVDDVRYLVD
jgi:hypothetical protein